MNLDERTAGRTAAVTLDQATKLLGVDLRTVSRAIRSGGPPVPRLEDES